MPWARVRETGVIGMVPFDYTAGADFFPGRSRKTLHRRTGYRRFAQAADAIRFVIKDLEPDLMLGTYILVDEERYTGADIRRLYESADYPLPRPTPS
jgi:hypothetical protein